MSLLLQPTHKIDAAVSYKMVVHLYQTAHHHISEGSDHQNSRVDMWVIPLIFHQRNWCIMQSQLRWYFLSLTQAYKSHSKNFLVESVSSAKNQVYILLFSEVKCFLCFIQAFVCILRHHKIWKTEEVRFQDSMVWLLDCALLAYNTVVLQTILSVLGELLPVTCTLNKEAAISFEMLVTTEQTMWYHNQDHNLT